MSGQDLSDPAGREPPAPSEREPGALASVWTVSGPARQPIPFLATSRSSQRVRVRLRRGRIAPAGSVVSGLQRTASASRGLQEALGGHDGDAHRVAVR